MRHDSTSTLQKRLPVGARIARKRDALHAARAAGGEARITTAWVAHELNELLPRDAVLVNETITHRLDLLSLVDRLGPGGFYEASFGGLGVGLGVALGVKQAEPARTVVCTIGDGAFHYNPVPASFGAAQEHGLPIFVILFNNAGYLSQKADVAKYYPQGQAVKTGRFAGTSISPAPDYAALARAYGGVGEKVQAPGEVRAALQRGFDAVAQGRLALMDVVLKPVAPRWKFTPPPLACDAHCHVFGPARSFPTTRRRPTFPSRCAI